VKKEHPRIPTCTYRLQFNRWFTFAQAREIVAYLDALGVSDVYASPYFQASPESLHGYDIADHNKLNASIGSRADYDAWVGQLQTHGMGQVLDFVPNHVGVADSRNQWWMDVLENGPSSRYAAYFDIEWQPLKSDLCDKVLLPILADQYGRVLERGELQVRFEEGTFYLLYGQRTLPIAPGTYRYMLQAALANLAEYKDKDFYAELQSILTALEYLPKRTETDAKRIAERIREKEIIKRRLERRCAEAPLVQRAIEKALTQINGKRGDPRSFDTLDELLNAQSYRLAFWRVAAEEINYRRFFDVNDLAAIRVELPKVFRKTPAALRQGAGDRVAEGRSRHLHRRRKNSHWSREVAPGMACPRNEWIRFCQSSDPVACGFLGGRIHYEDVPPFHWSLDAFWPSGVCEKTTGDEAGAGQ